MPDIARLELAGHDAGVGFDIGSLPLLHPMLILIERGKGQVHQFVCCHPVLREVGRGCVLAYAYAGEGLEFATVGPGGALENAAAIGDGNDQHASAAHRETAVIRDDGRGGRADVLENGAVWKVERAGGEIDLQNGVAKMKRMGRRDLYVGPGWPVWGVLRRGKGC